MTVLLTGMSGTGKSTVLAELHRRGHRCVDLDEEGYSFETQVGSDGAATALETLWDAARTAVLLADGAVAVVAGCAGNQGQFYDRFEAVVLLSAPLPVIMDRVRRRANNPFGRTPAQRTRILTDVAEVEPLLRAGATAELDTRRTVAEVANEVEKYLR